jgi:hypothetical protein
MIVLHDSETPIMTAVEELFALEIEFHRKLRMSDPRPTDITGLHTSYALQAGYEQLIRDAGDVTGERLRMTGKAYCSPTTRETCSPPAPH